MWGYDAGHSKLLIRGFSDPESESGQDIVDVVFLNVTRMRVNSAYSKFSVRLRTESDGIPDAEIGRLYPDDKVYVINPGANGGFVVAERLDWATLDLRGHETSPLLAEDTATLHARGKGDIYWM